MSDTQMRVPLMHGLPKQTCGLIEIRLRQSLGVGLRFFAIAYTPANKTGFIQTDAAAHNDVRHPTPDGGILF